MAETNIDINGGHSQVNPAATQAVQNNYYGTPVPLHEEAAARTVVVLGAGVDTAAGFSNPCSLVPKITEWLETDEGKQFLEKKPAFQCIFDNLNLINPRIQNSAWSELATTWKNYMEVIMNQGGDVNSNSEDMVTEIDEILADHA